MATITPAQCRAARALLSWSQPELARRCNIHTQTVSNFESESTRSTLTKTNLDKITTTLENAGIEFLDGEGVRKKKNTIIIFQGKVGFADFYDDIYETAKNMGGEFCVSNVNEEIFDKWHKSPERLQYHLERMAVVIKNNPNFKMRILIEEGDNNFRATKYAKYRWVKKESFSNVPFYVYGDKLAILMFEDDNVYVCVLPNAKVADAYRKQFDITWEQGYEPPL